MPKPKYVILSINFPALPLKAENAIGMANKTEILAATNEIETAFTTFKNSKSEIPSLINHNEKIKMGSIMDSKTTGSVNKKKPIFCIDVGLIKIILPGGVRGTLA